MSLTFSFDVFVCFRCVCGADSVIGLSLITLLSQLTLLAPCVSESYLKIKINLNFYFALLCGASKGFMKASKAFIKPFERPQRSVKIKILINFSFFVGDRDGKG